jgi:hypothetical protein
MEKSRLNQMSQQQDRGDWRTFLIFSTNYSFTEIARKQAMGGDAAVARVLDFRVPPLPVGSAVKAGMISQLVSHLEYNNGHVGHAFIQYVTANSTRVASMVNLAFEQLMKVAHSNTSDVSGRNHVGASAAILVAAQIVEEQDLLPIKRRLVADAILEAIRTGRMDRKVIKTAQEPMRILADWLKAMEAHKLITIMLRADKKTVNATNLPKKQPVAYEVNNKDRELMVDLHMLYDWLDMSGHSVQEVMAALGKYKSPKRRALGEGTSMAGVARDVLIIPVADMDDIRHLFV